MRGPCALDQLADLYSGQVPELPDHFLGQPVGTAQISREVLAKHQRERVLILATAIFAKRGYRGTTIDDLLAAGKVGVGNFYYLFESKEECFLAAFERVVTNTRREMAEAAAAGSGWAEHAYLGLQALLAALLAEPLEARLVLVEAQGAGEAAINAYDALMDSAVEWLGHGRGLYSPAAKLPAGFEYAAVSGLAFYLQACLLDSRPHSLGQLLQETAGQLLEPIVGGAELGRIRQRLGSRGG